MCIDVEKMTAFLAKPDWGLAMKNTLIPQFNSDPGYLVMIVGLIASVIAFLNLWPRLSLLVCFVCFLSFVTATNVWSNYQSDGMLLEAGFLHEISILKTQYDHRDLCILDILNHGCSKGHALRRWAEKHGIRREQVMAIGDNFNDLEMLEFAGVAVVMGNASQELKQSGWKVTLSNAESGVAKAIKEILGLAFSG